MPLIYTFGNTSTDFGDGEVAPGYSPHLFAYGGTVTFAESGTVDQLGAFLRLDAAGSIDVKIALYDMSGNLVVDGGTFACTSDGAQAWYDSSTFTATAVTATDYMILTSTASTGVNQGYDSAFDGTGDSHAYADFPESSNAFTEGGETGVGFGRRVNFTADAGGITIEVPLGPVW